MAKPRRRDLFGSLVMRSRTGFLSGAAVVVVASLMLANSGRAFPMEQAVAGENASTHSPNDFGTVVSEDSNGDLVIASDFPSTVTQESSLSPLEIVAIVSDDRDRGSTLQCSDDLLTPIAVEAHLFQPQFRSKSTVVTGESIGETAKPIVEWIVEEEVAEEVVVVPSAKKEDDVVFSNWLGYNAAKSNTTWLADGDFGMFSLESFPTLDLGQDAALSFGTGFHFVNGPLSPDIPPRLFDFQLAYHARKQVSAHSMWDVKVGVGAFSDFEGSARKGVRFPGHAITYYEWGRECVSVFGVEVLDRDDISVLPVAGFVWQPRRDLVCELVFPRPKMRVQLNNNRAMYVAGELGGGTWAIKRPEFGNDNFTYRDLRVTVGIMEVGKKTDGALEIGWGFDRHLEFRSGAPVDSLDSALILQCQTHY